ncbi:hypothetical protein RirG_003230 [Rhizophagus irregularis DAOM 197198w]|uniref:Uncharacterized protein n=1 Tax=Rhizophagus irregularis (strain DAOM 197198w) TaxID=1432141 RepID=A0A015NJU9_RHIIW|nr:hypothetical protein RirG_003230 [Rhizophagus irregularis DAOM 197198w]
MPLRKWYQILCQRNPHFESYQRPYNNSWLVFDKSVPLEALDIHNELVTSSSSTTTPYLALTVHNYPKDNSTSAWVDLGVMGRPLELIKIPELIFTVLEVVEVDILFSKFSHKLLAFRFILFFILFVVTIAL